MIHAAAHDARWADFQQKYSLSALQIDQYKLYLKRLRNHVRNITAIVEEADVIAYHFEDALECTRILRCEKARIIDVGSGGGVPGIPLAIFAPQAQVTLIEVIGTKVTFLQSVIQEIGLSHVTVEQSDWRTFLRHTKIHVDIVCARASLQPRELIRMFQPSNILRSAHLVYWGTDRWIPSPQEKKFLYETHYYEVGNKKRALYLLKIP